VVDYSLWLRFRSFCQHMVSMPPYGGGVLQRKYVVDIKIETMVAIPS
jgi:hypothetical protein